LFSMGAVRAQQTNSTVKPKSGAPIASVKVDLSQPGSAIAPGFLGFSHEWGQGQMMLGDPALGVNSIYRQLLANLLAYGGGPLSIRIGGSTTDRTGEPRANSVTPFARLYEDLSQPTPAASFILGVNMGANDPALAARQAKAYLGGMPKGSVRAIEMGNQPDFFVLNKYRPAGYSFNDYLGEFEVFARSIKTAVPDSPRFMGPSNGGFAGIPPIPMAPRTNFGTPEDWKKLLDQQGSQLELVSQHAYTGGSSKCGDNPKPGFLLRPSSSTEDPKEAVPYVAVARTAGKPYRMAEMNSIMCSGEPGVSDAFEAALWAADILFEYARLGMEGVNLHTNTWNTIHGWDLYGAFLFDVPEAQYKASNTEATPPPGTQFPADYQLRTVLPLYYGLLFFAEATPHRSALLPVAVNTSANLKAWATRDATTGNIVVAVLNKDPRASGTVRLTVPGYSSGAIKRLIAPSFRAKSGITLGGQTFDGSRDGRPVGTERREATTAKNGVFEVAIGPTSAFLLTLKK
ncbi:MAG: hypothetical protein JWP22_4344, partial [Ramlibacter sp.]|nr:hypothetical protein [Ramlibacter sp.]